MNPSYTEWLRKAVPSEATFRTKLSDLRRIEAAYGDIDALYDQDELQNLIDDLTYSTADAREHRANPSRLQIDGDIRNNLASYKSAVQRYVRFRQEVELERAAPALRGERFEDRVAIEDDVERTFSLEKDMEAALRAHIAQLEPGLEVIDAGTQRSVPSGRIDILARDATGATVVIELKAVRAPRDAVAQTFAYMGDIRAETGGTVRGILVAPEFDPRAVAAATVVPTLTLQTYRFSFTFQTLG